MTGILIADLARFTDCDEAEIHRIFDEHEATQKGCADATQTCADATRQATATIYPFPIARQRQRIADDLESVADYSDTDADRYLRDVVRKHRAHLKRLGISPDLVAADVRDLQSVFAIDTDSAA